MSATDPFRMIGKTLAGHFLVQSLVGEGRFTIVYKGLHIGPKKPVALKCYKLGGWLDAATAETFLRRFREESKASSQVAKEQPAFVRSIGSGMTTSDDGVYIPYTVLEWLDGRSLARSVAERNQRNEQPYTLTALLQRLGPAVNGALVHAHTQKVFHGDINPGSFFLVGAEGIKLLDLGVAKVMRDLSREIAPQTALEKIFSPGHAAPEQFDPSQGEWSTATDVYALGMVLLEAMRGRPLLESHDLKDFARAALDPRRRPTPRAWGLSVFDPIEAVFARAVALAPAERWQDAGEFWAELEDAVRSEAPTRRVLVEDFAPDDDEAPELEVPSTEPRPHVAGHGAPFAPLPTAAKGVKPSKGATDDTSPNGALMDLAPAPLVSPPTAAPPVDRMSPVPPKSSAVDNAASGRPSVPRGLQPVKPVVGGLASPPSASSSGSASGSANLFKISPPTPSSATPTKNSATPPPGPTPLRPSTPHAPPQVTAPMVAAAPPSPIVAPPVLTSAAVQPVRRPASASNTVRGFPSPARLRSDVPPPKPSPSAPVPPPAAGPAPVAVVPPPAATPDLLKTPKPEPVEIRRDTPTMPIEPVHERPRLSPVPEAKAAEQEAGDAPRAVREMVPPPKANVAVGDLPSVIVDDPEQRKEKAARQRETVRLAMPPTPAVSWDAASANSALVAAAEDSEVSYPPRSMKKRRGLWGVALVSFLIVFLAGVVAIMIWRLSNEM